MSECAAVKDPNEALKKGIDILGVADQATPHNGAAANCFAKRDISKRLDLKEEGLSQRDVLLKICDRAILWRSQDGETFASVPVSTHYEHHAIRSRGFRDWMLVELARNFSLNGRPASAGANAVRDALQCVEAQSACEGVRYDARLRVIEHECAQYIDRGMSDWSAIRIENGRWNVVRAAPAPILRSKRTSALVELSGAKPSFQPLRRLLGNLSDDNFILLIAWWLGAWMPRGPHPVLLIGGEAGSGKSTIARLAQRMVDPINGDLLQPPGNDRDLIAAARHNWVLAFDNVSKVDAELADSLCRLATGGEIGGRAMYSDHDTASFSACRPIILNGIPDLASRGDLADRAVTIRLKPLDERMTERDWWRQADEALSPTLAALLDALALGRKRCSGVATPNVRMADFARLVVAAEPALPWRSGDFLSAYRKNRQQAVAALVDGDLVANAIFKFAKTDHHWEGLVSTLFDQLSADVPIEAKRSKDWPGNARWFSDRVKRAAPALRASGVDVTDRREAAGSFLTIRLIDTLAAPAALVPGSRVNPTGANVASVSSFSVGNASTTLGGECPVRKSVSA